MPHGISTPENTSGSSKFTPSDILAKPTINISQPTEIRDLFLGLKSALTATDITFTGNQIVKQQLEAAGDFMEDMNTLVSDVTVAPVLHEGNDANFDETWIWRPDGDVFVYKCVLRACIGMNCSAFTSGVLDMEEVTVTITIHDAAGVQVGNPVLEVVANPVFTGLTATGALMFIIDDLRVPVLQFKIKRSFSVRLRITATGSETGVSTFQLGIMPVFKYHPEAGNMIFTESVLRMYTKSGLDNSYPIIRDQSAQQAVDYSGVTRTGDTRT